MKNFKQIALGLAVGAMAIGFSAFTNANNSNLKYNRNAKGEVVSVTASYYRKPAAASTSTDLTPADYVFSSGAHANCTSGTSNICSSQWTTAVAPTNGQTPVDAGSPNFVSNNPLQGIYNGQ